MPSDWEKTDLMQLIWRIEKAPAKRRWRWKADRSGHSTRLQVVDEHGTVWDFKLAGGAWLRRAWDQKEK